MKPHICFIAPYSYPSFVGGTGVKHAGGAEIQQAMIARLLAREGHRVSVLVRDFGQAAHVRADGVDLYRLPSTQSRGIRGLRWLTPRLTDIVAQLEALNPDYVYVRTATAYAAPAAWWARRANKRFIFAGASDTDFSLKRPERITRRDWWFYQWGLKRADQILVQNQHQMEQQAQHPGLPARLCPNFLVDSAAVSARADGPVVWVGTLRPVKQPDLFVELARRLPHRRFIMVGGEQVDAGGGAIVERVHRLAQGLTNLELRGYVPPQEVGRVYEGASALINTSTHEGFPNTFLQAWLRGVPSLSFVNPQTAPGESGTVVCADVEQMAAALEALLSDPQAWQRQSEHVLQVFASQHTEAAALARYQQIFIERNAA